MGLWVVLGCGGCRAMVVIIWSFFFLFVLLLFLALKRVMERKREEIWQGCVKKKNFKKSYSNRVNMHNYCSIFHRCNVIDPLICVKFTHFCILHGPGAIALMILYKIMVYDVYNVYVVSKQPTWHNNEVYLADLVKII